MSGNVPEFFEGFAIPDEANWDRPKLVKYEHKALKPYDVVVEVECCGICGSDVHIGQGNWGPIGRKNLVLGHEIVGKVVYIGEDVKLVKLGQRVGVGAHCRSCMICSRCNNNSEQFCTKRILTYNTIDPDADNYVTQGGYANFVTAHEHYVFPVPDKLSSEHAAPLMCAGLTVYSPLVRTLGKDLTGKTVGIVGIGGLGHLAIQFAASLGANTIAFSRSSSKREDAIALGAKELVAVGEDPEWTSKYSDKFDMILNCSSSFTQNAISPYLSVLNFGGTFCNVGAPSLNENLVISPFSIFANGLKITGTVTGSRQEALDMLQLCADKDIKPYIEKFAIDEENCHKALTKVNKGDVHYRVVLVNFDKVFKKN